MAAASQGCQSQGVEGARFEWVFVSAARLYFIELLEIIVVPSLFVYVCLKKLYFMTVFKMLLFGNEELVIVEKPTILFWLLLIAFITI